MKPIFAFVRPGLRRDLALLFLTAIFAGLTLPGRSAEIPAPLQPWMQWALWDDRDVDCPPGYMNPEQRFCTWPSLLNLDADASGARFDFEVEVFTATWVGLPGGNDSWPAGVTAGDQPLAVIERSGAPAVFLPAGYHQVSGRLEWQEMPQTIALPPEIGVVRLRIDGVPVELPVWDASGQLWLRRDRVREGETAKDFLGVQVYAKIEDGIPMWLRVEVELVVAGKSREEQIGGVLPAGWKLAAVRSPVPTAVDDAGRLKAQVRPGKWKVQLDAFRLDSPQEIAFPADVQPAVTEELIAFQARPDFRMVDLVGIPVIDVAQTTFPDAWRQFPVYRWETKVPFRIEERLRGMGQQRPAGLDITRTLWLDEAGGQIIFRDRVAGSMQQIWRLDAAEGIRLGSVRSDGTGQLITRNPETGAAGVELRSRQFNLEATGSLDQIGQFSATGWQADADAARVTLNLPPGWRLAALFGADWVHGDWLTAWTLLDLFLLLVFSLAIYRLWGVGPALLAFAAFGLSYHEPDSPRYVWLALLAPLALLRVVPAGLGRKLLLVWKWATVAVLLLILIPFVAAQVQQALYPQLESRPAMLFPPPSPIEAQFDAVMEAEVAPPMAGEPRRARRAEAYALSVADSAVAAVAPKSRAMNANLLYDPKARIQTGPGVPDWDWRTVEFGWNGPVQGSQTVRPVLIPIQLERALAVFRVLLLLWLAAVLLDARRFGGSLFAAPAARAAALAFVLLVLPASGLAGFPDQKMIEQLRERLLEPSDAFPRAAEIPAVILDVSGRKLNMQLEVHSAARVAVPLPGRLPVWSPVRVTVDGRPDVALRRQDGFLWLVVPPGVSEVRVEGMLPNVAEWEWAFQLRPKKVVIRAPGWNVSGVRHDGVPGDQVFFSRQDRSAGAEAGYETQEVSAVVQVERRIELGLVWQVQTTVRRLSPPGRAISLRVPLVEGENVLTQQAVVADGKIEVRLGANEQTFAWQSELPVRDKIELRTAADDSWVEQWQLVVSPVWNLGYSGLAPFFQPENPELIPVWNPWPGEAVALQISRPEAVPGETVTVEQVNHELALGRRQRSASLAMTIRASLGEDFLLGLPDGAEVTALTHSGGDLPVRKDEGKIVIPLRPGTQEVTVGWKEDVNLETVAQVGAVVLPVDAANIRTTLRIPEDRWILWTNGPLRGPAVRFWTILACSLLAAWALARVRHSPLRSSEWMLLAIGLTQAPVVSALIVVGWLFLLAWRGRDSYRALSTPAFNLLQICLIAATFAALGILLAAVGRGLLGSPEMFVAGNGSSAHNLQWYAAESGGELPRPSCLGVSIWWYRFFMLAWALWLAVALLRWLAWGWGQFSSGGCFRGRKRATPPPPLPTA